MNWQASSNMLAASQAFPVLLGNDDRSCFSPTTAAVGFGATNPEGRLITRLVQATVLVAARRTAVSRRSMLRLERFAIERLATVITGKCQWFNPPCIVSTPDILRTKGVRRLQSLAPCVADLVLGRVTVDRAGRTHLHLTAGRVESVKPTITQTWIVACLCGRSATFYGYEVHMADSREEAA